MKRFFHVELEDFRSSILLMGEKAIEIVRMAVQSLVDQDLELAQSLKRRDDSIDELEKVVDAEAIRYISLRAPVAGELRLLTVGMKVGHELERVGDEATTIAKRALRLANAGPLPRTYGEIPAMADEALEMLRDAIRAFIEGDDANARAIIARDAEVDRLNKANQEFFVAMMEREPHAIQPCLELLWISKSLERVADHAKNIAEEVIFILHGEDVRHTGAGRELRRQWRTSA